MSGFTYIVIGGILALVGSILTTIGINKLKRAEEAYSLSVPPSVETTIKPNNETRVQDIIIENTGQNDLIDITLSPVSYVIAKNPLKVRSRISSFAIQAASTLKPREKATISSTQFVFTAPDGLADEGTIKMFALVVVFRRNLDNKRYVEIEPFTTETIDGTQVLFALYSDRGTGLSGPPGLIISAIKEVNETENLFFRAK